MYSETSPVEQMSHQENILYEIMRQIFSDPKCRIRQMSYMRQMSSDANVCKANVFSCYCQV